MADSQALTDLHAVESPLRHHFADMEQQKESSELGMWLFLITEILFFGGLFTAYLVFRLAYPHAWETGSEHMNFWLGTTNTVVLLCSSLTMAIAVRCAQTGNRKLIVLFLLLTILMGIGFLGIKAVEYHEHYADGAVPGSLFHLAVADAEHVQMFFFLYFTMTGLHALHMLIGVCLVGTIAYFAWRGKYGPHYYNPVEISGLYWHFVDIVWIFLYPLLYLIAHKHA